MSVCPFFCYLSQLLRNTLTDSARILIEERIHTYKNQDWISNFRETDIHDFYDQALILNSGCATRKF